MTLKEAEKTVVCLNITDDKNDLTFKSCVILLLGLSNGTVGCMELKRLSGYWWKEVFFILNNFWANYVISEYKWNVCFSETEMENIVELTLISLCGAGEVVRYSEDSTPPEEKSISWDEFNIRTTYCHDISTARTNLKKTIEEIREQNQKIEDSFMIYTPVFSGLPEEFIEKQKRIKNAALNFDSETELLLRKSKTNRRT